MAYRTYHEFTASNHKTPSEPLPLEIQEALEDALNEMDLFYDIWEYGGKVCWNTGEPIRWYDCDDDMKQLSSQFPEVLIKMEVEGEENGDLWINYFLNGKMQHCPAIITYDEFDTTKLK